MRVLLAVQRGDHAALRRAFADELRATPEPGDGDGWAGAAAAVAASAGAAAAGAAAAAAAGAAAAGAAGACDEDKAEAEAVGAGAAAASTGAAAAGAEPGAAAGLSPGCRAVVAGLAGKAVRHNGECCLVVRREGDLYAVCCDSGAALRLKPANLKQATPGERALTTKDALWFACTLLPPDTTNTRRTGEQSSASSCRQRRGKYTAH